MPKTESINLLRASQTHYMDSIMKWALTTGRFLIILTETVALAAFVYRFTLDRQIIDLHDEIKNNAAIVALYTQEPAFRNLHERLTFANTLNADPASSQSLLQQFVEIAQGKIVYQSLTVSKKAVTMTINASSTNALSSFIEAIKTIPSISSVTINRVENKSGAGTITVDISAQLLGAEPVTDGTATEEVQDGN